MKNTAVLVQPRVSFIDKWCRSVLYQKLAGIKEGYLEIEDAYLSSGEVHHFGQPGHELTAKIKIQDPEVFSKLVLGGSIGSGEGYMAGEWEVSDLTQLIRIFVRNREVLQDLDGTWASLSGVVQRLAHRLKENSVRGARKNIRAHYDLGNDFFALFLGQSWMYSSAIFLNEQMSLEDGQYEKLDRICRKLNLKPDDEVIEIGTGWGGFALHAAKHYGCKVTTTTISKKQFDLAKARIQEAGLEGQITLLDQDYRVLQGKFDHLVSIEMIEAVGLNFLGTFFEKCFSLLKPTGQMLLQGITIRDQYYEAAKQNVDFIQRYIFPGSAIPSVGSLTEAIAKHTNFQLVHFEDFGASYAKTLNTWRERLKANHGEVLRLGYSESLYRMWLFYFSYCEGGFLEKSIGVMQMHLKMPRCLKENSCSVY